MAFSSGFTKTYKLEVGPPAEAFVAYAGKILPRYNELIDADPDEPAVQQFLEKHACLLPSMRSLGPLPSSFPTDGLLVSQPRLPALTSRLPDFMWIATNSIGIYPTLIEIERPGKRVFTSAGAPTAEFTQARHQLAQWRGWFSMPENEVVFKREYGVGSAPNGSEMLEPRYILVFGRRSELENDPALRRERAFLLDGNIESLVSYDRLVPDRMMENVITVRALGDGRFHALAVPPTFTLGPLDAKRLLIVDGMEEAISSAELMSDERKAFLLKRLPYWRTWAREGGGGFFGSMDVE